VLFDPNTVREDATVALSEFSPDVQGRVVAYAVSDGGTDWQIWRFRRVRDGADLPDILRFTKFWGVSWARDGSGVYYSRYPALPDSRDDSARPAVYFHQLGTAQDHDRLVYEVTDHPTRIPAGRVTDDGHYLIITLFDGYERNGVNLLDLRRPGARVQRLFFAWDALYTFIGARGEDLYFRTTKDAPLGRVIALDARAPSHLAHGGAGGDDGARGGDLRRRPDRREVRGGCAWRRAVVRAQWPSGRQRAAARSGRDRGLPGRGQPDRDVLLLHRLPDAPQDLPLRGARQPGDAVARGARSGPARRNS